MEIKRNKKMERRSFLTGTAGVIAGGFTAGAANAKMKMEPPWAWTKKHGLLEHLVVDADPATDNIKKFKRCIYCGMSLKKWSHTRHLVQYEDDSSEGTCSIRCMTISLSLNLDRLPKNIWVGDAGSDAEIKPLIKVDDAHYAIEVGKMGTMTANRKWAYADKSKAQATGGKVVSFDEAIVAAYTDQATDTLVIRKRREEKRSHMKRKMQESSN